MAACRIAFSLVAPCLLVLSDLHQLAIGQSDRVSYSSYLEVVMSWYFVITCDRILVLRTISYANTSS